MTSQLNHLIARQQIMDSHEASSMARLVSGERLARSRVKPIIALLTLCGAAALAGASVLAHAARAAQPPGAHCQIRLPISLTATPSHSPARRYDASGPAACTGWLGPWLTTGGTGSASSSGAITLATHGTKGCIASTGHGQVFAVVPRQAWFFPPEVTFSGAFRWHRTDGVLQLTGRGRLVRTREAPVSARISLSGTVAFAPRVGQACNSRRLRGTLTLALAVQRA
jgi:hypothetical protein